MSTLHTIHLRAEGRDPFVSILDLEKLKLRAENKIDASGFVLKGIIWNEKVAVAIINDELVMVGDECKGVKIENIDKDSVTLSKGLESCKLSIPEETELSPAETPGSSREKDSLKQATGN